MRAGEDGWCGVRGCGEILRLAWGKGADLRMTMLVASSEKGKRFNTEATEENRRTQRKIRAYCKFKSNG